MIKVILKYKFLIIAMVLTLFGAFIYNNIPKIKESYNTYEENSKTKEIMNSLINQIVKKRDIYLDKNGNLNRKEGENQYDFPVDHWGRKLVVNIINYEIHIFSYGKDESDHNDDIVLEHSLPHGFIYNIFGI